MVKKTIQNESRTSRERADNAEQVPIAELGSVYTLPAGTKLMLHPLSVAYPSMPRDQAEILKNSLQTNGQINPIIRYQGKTLDGRERSLQLDDLNMPIMAVDYLGDDPVGFVWALNSCRKSFTAGQRLFVAAKMTTLKPGEKTKSGSKEANLSISLDEASKMTGLSVSTVKKAKKILDAENEDLIRAVVEEPCIVLNSGIVTWFDDNELTYILGHELGHVLSDHLKYQTLLWILTGIGLTGIPMAGLAKMALDVSVLPLLLLWSRRAEFSCDRVGLLACQSLDTACHANMKMSGFPIKYFDSISPKAILTQADAYQDRVAEGWMTRIRSTKNQLFATHPRTIERAAELNAWIREGWYAEIIHGTRESRQQLASQLTKDSRTAELVLLMNRSITEICVKKFGLSRDVVAPLIRKALYSGQSLKDTWLQQVLRIELQVEHPSADAVEYSLIFLINENGKAMRHVFQLPTKEEWAEAPEEIRNELTRSSQKSIIRLIYSV